MEDNTCLESCLQEFELIAEQLRRAFCCKDRTGISRHCTVMGISTVFGLAVLGFVMTSCFGYASKLTKGTDTSKAIQRLFSATFSLTCGLFGLIIFEITSIMDKQ